VKQLAEAEYNAGGSDKVLLKKTKWRDAQLKQYSALGQGQHNQSELNTDKWRREIDDKNDSVKNYLTSSVNTPFFLFISTGSTRPH